ncbi:LysR family transcriptional regulator [Aestuariibacter sp. AA17]|uniref:LysR family transcriptional regulator n=1 Tax=Fluctibacter corallii TaxID=2984329 RepID=A0ABT3A6X8_9ALTE|nr:LysR family transcriptional regulator [Aestuariibacter sp. AA17]MCV2884442.1 LysR family transcriptional regulator [Aestuariibacter sp. AA17]
MINSDDLAFFQMIASNPSLAETARTLNVTPPTVTQRLQTLEQKLQLKLVERHARRISLTEEGALLAQKGKLILTDLADLIDDLDRQKKDISGCLRVLSPFSFGQQYIAPLLAEFQSLYPNLTIELELSDIPNWSVGKSWDVIIYIGELRDSSLTLHHIAPNGRFLCASPSYLEKHGFPSHPDDLRDHQCIALRENAEDVTMWRFSNSRTNEQSAIRITPKLASNDSRVAKQWALQGLGIIHRSEWDLTKEIKEGRLVRLLPDYRLPSANIVALTGTNHRAQTLRTAKFLEMLKHELGAKPWYD